MGAELQLFSVIVSSGKAEKPAQDKFVISENELCSGFVGMLYGRYPEWMSFDVFSADGDKLLCRISNTAYMRKTRKLSPFGLKLSIKKHQAGIKKEIRDKRLVVLFSKTEYDNLVMLHSKSNQGSLSEFVRELTLDSSARFMSPDQAADLKTAVRLLANIANNINQVAFKFNSFKQGDTYSHLGRQIDEGIRTVEDLKSILAKIRLT